MPPTPLRIRILGTPALLDEGGEPAGIPVGKPLALLTLLHLEGRGIPRNDLATRFWPGVPTDRARASLRQTLWLLRKALGDDVLQRDDPVELAGGRVVTDLELLWPALEAAADPLPVLDGIWEEPPFRLFPLHDVPEWEIWTEEIRSRAESRLGSFLEDRGGEALRSGNAHRCALLLERVTRIQPHRAGVWLTRLSALLDARQVAEADEVLADARSRFGDEAEWLRDLAALEERLRELKRVERKGHGSGGIRGLEFVGRSGEYARLHGLWREAREGSASLALVTGDPGIGKTTLGEQVAQLVTPSTGRVIRVTAREGDEAIDRGLLTDLIRSLLRLSGAAGISKASDRTLRQLVPSLDSGPVAPDRSPGAGASGTAALGDALQDLIVAVSDDAPLFLLLDDLQWADGTSRAVVLWALRRLDRHQVFALLTCRAGGWGEVIRRGLEGAPRLVSEPLKPLFSQDVEEAVGLLAEFLPPEEADRVVARLHRESLGNPLYLLEILRYLAEQGILEQRPGESWLLHCQALPEQFPLPASVRELLKGSIRILPEEARTLLRRLLLAPRGLPPGVMEERGGGGGEGGRGVSELLTRGLIRRNDEGELVFAHDEVRAAAAEELGERRRRAGDAPEPRTRWQGWIAAAVVGAALIAAGSLLKPAAADPGPPPPYGGGTIFAYTRDQAVEIRPQGDDPTAWPVAPSQRFRPGQWLVRILGRDPEGRLIWLEDRASVNEAPAVFVRREDGVEWLAFQTSEDDYGAGIAPDGRSILVLSEDQEAEEWTLDLLRVPLEGGEGTTILRNGGRGGQPSISPDGTRILTARMTERDLLLVLRPDGEVMAEYPMEVDGPMIWCGGGHRVLIGVPDPGGGVQLALLDPESLQTRAVPTPGYVGFTATCSPDGRAAVYQAAVQGEIVTVLHDLEADRWFPLDLGPIGAPVRLSWVPDGPRPVAAALEVPSAPRTLVWGERRSVEPELVYSDGTRMGVAAAWVSSDPSVVSVAPGGELFANSLGEARVTATWDGWLHTDFPVEVTGDPGRGTLLSDDFATLDPGLWIGVGDPLPVPGEVEGEPVLVMRGDGLHRDGLLLREPLTLDQGTTVEMEFRMPLTRRLGQRFQLCLQDIPLPDPAVQRVDYLGLPINEGTCLVYPDGRLGAQAVSFADGFAYQRVDLPPHLSSDDWIHLGLQVRGDGQVMMVLDREVAAEGVVRLSSDPGSQWRISLTGEALGTELLVRQLRVWQGERY
jgi:DNA-binding SARP family transcriptional activator/energy-coupling factor transporter ATP-binding protein EcfA2